MEVAESLALDVYSRCIREEEQRRIHDPLPLPVRWRSAPEELLDHGDDIGGATPGTVSGPLPPGPPSLDGGLADIADVYRRVRSGRLLVLGRAGSGKTVLVMRFVLDYPVKRSDDEPVPVVFGIGSWDPTADTLRDWLIARLLRDHPDLDARGPGGAPLAAALVDAGWILPLTRVWLPLTGRLPWAIVTFLDNAYRRGVLRQVGAVYRFRHARLQRHLVNGPVG